MNTTTTARVLVLDVIISTMAVLTDISVQLRGRVTLGLLQSLNKKREEASWELKDIWLQYADLCPGWMEEQKNDALWALFEMHLRLDRLIEDLDHEAEEGTLSYWEEKYLDLQPESEDWRDRCNLLENRQVIRMSARSRRRFRVGTDAQCWKSHRGNQYR